MSSELWQLEHVASHMQVSDETLLCRILMQKVCKRKVPK